MHAIKKRLPWLIRSTLELGQRFKVNISPAHFYSETPDLRRLRESDYWRRPWPMTGVRSTDLDAYLTWVHSACDPWRDRLAGGAVYRDACRLNGEEGYGPIEGDLLYGVVRTHRPSRIVQVGCGVSTQIILAAARDERAGGSEYTPEVVCIDPFPSPGLRDLSSRGLIRLVAEPAETVSLRELTDLPRGGMLFIDSSHSTRIGGEVPRLILEALPSLPPGILVHFHDIQFPYDYGTHMFTPKEIFFNRESTLLMAFLTFNDRFEIAASMSMLAHARSESLKECFPRFRPCPLDRGLRTGDGDFPSALYLRTLDPSATHRSS